jgi:hypothetical protein
MSEFLNRRQNFNLEYFVLFNDQMVNYLSTIINGTCNLRQFVNNSTSGSLREGIQDSLLLSRDSIIEVYYSLFPEIPAVAVESNVINHFNVIIESIDTVNSSSFLGLEITAFVGSILVNLPVEQWLPFMDSILSSSGVVGNSVHHYQLIFASWGVEINRIPYSDFQPLLATSAEIYKGINTSFYGSAFTNAALNEVAKVAAAVVQSSVSNTTATLVGLTVSSNEAIAGLGAQQLDDMISVFGSSTELSVRSFISWAAENRVFLSSAFMLAGGAVSLFRGLGSSHNSLGILSSLQDVRSVTTGPIEIPPILMPEIPSTEIGPILDILLPSTNQVGLVGGIFVVTLLVLKKGALTKILSILWHK